MWNLYSIKATNLCAFESFEYKLTQDHATLIFGNNMDNESQNSNGSGKSALIEAIAIALTGETLRKVNMDEIINDSHDVSEIYAVLVNTVFGIRVEISRKLSRKNPQEIVVTVNNEGDLEVIKQANVNDYNKYILDLIGLSKDDIFSNFILTARKYRSFLSSSDSTKKEIINRFSNGIIVDESIDALRKDIEPLQKQLSEAECRVSECRGRVSALSSEIERVIEESASRSENKKARIASWNEAIANKRAHIRENNAQIKAINNQLDSLDELDEKMQKLEKSKKDTKTAFESINELFLNAGLDFAYDYESRFNQLQDSLVEAKSSLNTIDKSKKSISKKLDDAQRILDDVTLVYESESKAITEQENDVKKEIEKLQQEILSLQKSEKEMSSARSRIVQEIASIEKQLAGVIECPKCGHEFTLSGGIDIEKTRELLDDKKNEEANIESMLKTNSDDYQHCISEGNAARQKEALLQQQYSKLKKEFNDAATDLSLLKSEFAKVESELERINATISSVTHKIDVQRTEMFNEAFDVIDATSNTLESQIQNLALSNSNNEGAIKSYEESIREIEHSSETDVIAKLKESKEKYEQELQESINSKCSVERELNELKVQEATFVEFKTHLANTKINAISKITNDFLETIGSDIRVSLSGYTILKSGKVRDKISVSLVRDGVDCGSFEKFSKGEQTRVELANILALHKLTNVNCEEGKGLNLLVFDEILDATDEQGLTNVFKALNDTHITSLVVSHGNIAENYPNRLVVNKHNGISFL